MNDQSVPITLQPLRTLKRFQNFCSVQKSMFEVVRFTWRLDQMLKRQIACTMPVSVQTLQTVERHSRVYKIVKVL